MKTLKQIVEFPLLAALLLLLLSGPTAIAQGKCVFEGREVPCDEWIKKPTPASKVCMKEGVTIPCDDFERQMHAHKTSTGKCTWNGEEIPCAEAKEKLKNLFGPFKKFFGLGASVLFALGFFALAIGIVLFALWIMMLVHAASNEIENKVMWIVLMVFIGLPVSVVYYFVVKRNFQPPPKKPTVTS